MAYGSTGTSGRLVILTTRAPPPRALRELDALIGPVHPDDRDRLALAIGGAAGAGAGPILAGEYRLGTDIGWLRSRIGGRAVDRTKIIHTIKCLICDANGQPIGDGADLAKRPMYVCCTANSF